MPTAAGLGAPLYHYQYQPLLIVDQTPVVQNTWYTLLDTTEDIMVSYIHMKQINDEAAGKTTEVRLTIDGNVYTTAGVALGNDGWLCVTRNTDSDVFQLTGFNRQPFNYSGDDQENKIFAQSLKIEARITDAPGTNQHLYLYLAYHLFRET